MRRQTWVEDAVGTTPAVVKESMCESGHQSCRQWLQATIKSPHNNITILATCCQCFSFQFFIYRTFAVAIGQVLVRTTFETRARCCCLLSLLLLISFIPWWLRNVVPLYSYTHFLLCLFILLVSSMWAGTSTSPWLTIHGQAMTNVLGKSRTKQDTH